MGTAASLKVDREQGATFVELFFDLVFVYAVTQLTSFVLHDLTWTGVGKAAVLFWLVWWSWTQFTWTLNEADTEHALVRLPTLLATAVAFFLAQALPDAYGDAGAWFAGAYVLTRVIGMGLQVRVLRDDELPQQALWTWTAASAVGLALVVAGGLADEARVWFWVAAIVADLAAAGFAGRGAWELEAGHFAERHGLIVIIALGESLIAAGVASADATRDLTFAIVTAGAVLGACALWWTYFGQWHGRLEEALDRVDDASLGAFARDVFSLSHALVVAGVIGVAVGFEEAIAHPADHLHGEVVVAFCIGAALFVGGLGLAAARAGLGARLLPRAAFVVVVLASMAWLGEVSAGWAVWFLAAAATALAVVEGRGHREAATV